MSIKRVGLTGGIGSGKSTVASMFAGLGVPVLDLDKVGHAVVAPGSAGLNQLVAAFGTTILNGDGSLNRKQLADICFADAEHTSELNAIVHPLIWQAEADWLEQQQGDYAIIEAAVLLESGGQKRMDAIIVVLAGLDVRRQRVIDRGERSGQAFDAIVARQCDDQARIAAADFIIHNNGEMEALRWQVNDIHMKVLSGTTAGDRS